MKLLFAQSICISLIASTTFSAENSTNHTATNQEGHTVAETDQKPASGSWREAMIVLDQGVRNHAFTQELAWRFHEILKRIPREDRAFIKDVYSELAGLKGREGRDRFEDFADDAPAEPSKEEQQRAEKAKKKIAKLEQDKLKVDAILTKAASEAGYETSGGGDDLTLTDKITKQNFSLLNKWGQWAFYANNDEGLTKTIFIAASDLFPKSYQLPNGQIAAQSFNGYQVGPRIITDPITRSIWLESRVAGNRGGYKSADDLQAAAFYLSERYGEDARKILGEDSGLSASQKRVQMKAPPGR